MVSPFQVLARCLTMALSVPQDELHAPVGQAFSAVTMLWEHPNLPLRRVFRKKITMGTKFVCAGYDTHSDREPYPPWVAQIAFPLFAPNLVRLLAFCNMFRPYRFPLIWESGLRYHQPVLGYWFSLNFNGRLMSTWCITLSGWGYLPLFIVKSYLIWLVSIGSYWEYRRIRRGIF